MKKHNVLMSILVVYILLSMIIFPQLYIQKTLDGISVWAFNVLPCILPFVFFTKILSITGVTHKLSSPFQKPCKTLFKTPPISSYVFLMSAISGYPLGAKLTADLYQSGQISKSDAFKMLSFCSTSGPMFIIGAVGIGMLKNQIYGYLIFISHIIGALLNGLLYRNLKAQNDKQTESFIADTKTDLADIVYDSLTSVLSIGVIISIFFVVIASFQPIFNILPEPLLPIAEGVIEITKGCLDVSTIIKGIWQPLICTFLISFGGISTILQSLTMLTKLKMPTKLFILQKLTHAILASVICALLCLIIL